MKKISFLIYFLLFLFTAWLGWLFKDELFILSEVNDNTFQLSMVKQTQTIFDQVKAGKLPFWSLLNYTNPLWGQGTPLSLYYNHLPQLFIVLSHQVINLIYPLLSIDTYYEIIKYCLLIFTPVSFFFGARLLGYSLWASLITAIISASLRTYGSFGLDASSYVFAGYGLASQLTAVFFMPLAFGKAYQFISSKGTKSLLGAVVLNFLTIQFHLGTGTILLISELFLIINFKSGKFDFGKTVRSGKRLAVLGLATILAVGYSLIPALATDSYRNFSVWEGLWKFNSFGWQKVLADLLNGQLFDYQRWPLITFFVLASFLIVLTSPKYIFVSFGFGFWVLAFFGRTTWGAVFDFLPGLKDFYLHRFITGVHFFGIILTGLGFETIILKIKKYTKIWPIIALFFSAGLFFLLSKETVKYSDFNRKLIVNANQNFIKDNADFEKISQILALKNTDMRRIFAGTPGGWGRNFTVGSSPVYQRLSVLGYPVMTFYAHSWSLSSQTEPFFDDTREDDGRLYNVGFYLVPLSYQAPSFTKEIALFGKYRLLELKNYQHFSLVKKGPVFAGTKNNFVNAVHLWLKSDWLKNRIYPILSFSQNKSFAPDFVMADLNNYYDIRSQQTKGLYFNNPFKSLPETISGFSSQEHQIKINSLGSQSYRLEFDNKCSDCLVVFSQSYHPYWQIKINGKKINSLMAFPGFLAFKPEAGFQQVEINYSAPALQKILLAVSCLTLITLFVASRRK